MKLTHSFLLAFLCLVTSCAKEDPPETIYLKSSFKKYCAFQPGSYWIYKNEATQEEDSFYVATLDHSFALNSNGYSGRERNVEYYHCIIHAANNSTRLEYRIEAETEDIGSCEFGGEFLCDTVIRNWEVTPGVSDYGNGLEQFDVNGYIAPQSLTVNGIQYTGVYLISEFGNYVWMKKEIGMIKFIAPCTGSQEHWTLVRSHVVF